MWTVTIRLSDGRSHTHAFSGKATAEAFADVCEHLLEWFPDRVESYSVSWF